MYIVFDIGGTHMRVAGSADGVALGEPIVEQTPADFTEGVQLLKKLFATAAGGEPIKAVAGGLAGIMTPLDKMLFYSPNLKKWEGNSLRKALIDGGYDVYVENDAALAALGEASHGAGRGGNIIAYYTVSTGIGGARIVDGRIDRHIVGFEPGKQIVNNGTLWSVEQFASGHTIEERYGTKPSTIVNPSLWKKAAEDLAIAAFNSIVHWSPDTFVFGGPMILHKPGIDLKDVEVSLNEFMKIFPVKPAIRQAELGDKSGLYGALQYLTQSHF